MVWLPTTHFITSNGVTHAVKERKSLRYSQLTGNKLLHLGKAIICKSCKWSEPRRKIYIFYFASSMCLLVLKKKKKRQILFSKQEKIFFEPILWFSVDMARDTKHTRQKSNVCHMLLLPIVPLSLPPFFDVVSQIQNYTWMFSLKT